MLAVRTKFYNNSAVSLGGASWLVASRFVGSLRLGPAAIVL